MDGEFDGGVEEETREVDARDALTPRQERALQAYLFSRSQKEAALAAGVSESTLWRYKQDPGFSRRLREAQRAAVNHAFLRLQRASGDAVTVLHDLMMMEDAPAGARVCAIRRALDYSFRSAEVEELKARIDLLEEFIRLKQEGDDLDAANELEKESDS
jgi:DNA-binding CsgD family transcriptional regulator